MKLLTQKSIKMNKPDSTEKFRRILIQQIVTIKARFHVKKLEHKAEIAEKSKTCTFRYELK